MSGLPFRGKKLFKITRRTVRPIFLCCPTLYSALYGPRVAFEAGRLTSPLVQTSLGQLRVTLMVGNEPNSTGNEMKALMAAIALLCVSSTVLAHDIYSNLRDRDGHLCCGGQDCTPVQATVLPNGDYYLPSTGEIIPADMATPSPDDRFHHCGYYPILYVFDPLTGQWERESKTRCFFAPMHSS